MYCPPDPRSFSVLRAGAVSQGRLTKRHRYGDEFTCLTRYELTNLPTILCESGLGDFRLHILARCGVRGTLVSKTSAAGGLTYVYVKWRQCETVYGLKLKRPNFLLKAPTLTRQRSCLRQQRSARRAGPSSLYLLASWPAPHHFVSGKITSSRRDRLDL
ncbi:hypothetical protein EVAR_18108_1 [Eumeta japonica]|uniref:Uncharacterized protein n=1 Tax=Eumeta variegata TaxID=151549 RepID=A0A4C1VI17_EUMVA|nr:hypothetical protein EVAR_18108_1 [Eumeta japonica]